MRSVSIRVAATVGTLFACGSCTGKDPYNPGESLGTFTVQAKRLTASCGDQQLPAEDPWRFDVRLAQEGRKLFWIQGGLPVSGALDSSNRASMKSADSRTLREAVKSPPVAACIVRREDALDATLAVKDTAAGIEKLDVTSFTGSLVYRFIPEDGSDCQDVVAGGTFASLPCDVSFQLSGVPKANQAK